MQIGGGGTLFCAYVAYGRVKRDLHWGVAGTGHAGGVVPTKMADWGQNSTWAIQNKMFLVYYHTMKRVTKLLSKSRHAAYVPCAVFLAWYCWAQSWQPRPALWWMAMPLCAALLAAAYKWPRSIYYWLPASIMGVNLWLFWLPWPQAQFACVGPAVVGCTAIFLAARAEERAEATHVPFLLVLLYGCLGVAAALGVLSHFVLKEEAAWNELWSRIRIMPLLGDLDRYAGLRYVWMWALALMFHLAMYRIMRTARDVWLLLWSVQWASVAAAALALYQCAAQHGALGPADLARRLSAAAGGPLVLANILIVCCVIGAQMARLQGKGWRRGVLVACVALQATGVVASGSMANMAILGMFGIAWLRPWLKKMLALPFPSLVTRSLMLGIGAVVVAGGLWLALPEYLRASVRNLPAVRLFAHDPLRLWYDDTRTLLPRSVQYWYAAAGMAFASPLWGVGCGRFAQEYVQGSHSTPAFPIQAHNLYLRVCAEGGLVTAAALALFLAVVARRIRWCFEASAESTLMDQVALARILARALAAIALASLVTDAWYDTPACVMFLALLATCARRSCDHLATEHGVSEEDITEDDWPFEPGHLFTRVRDGAHSLALLLTWGHLPQIPLKWLAGGIVLGGLATVGFFNSRHTCGRIMYEDSLMFGWHAPVEAGTDWGGVGQRATLYTTMSHPVASFSVKAINARVAVEANALTLYINNAFTAVIPLDSVSETRCYFDVSALVGKVAALRFETTRVYVPAHEGFFPDSRPHGALMTPVAWLDEAPTGLVRSVSGVWNNQWTEYAAAYEKMGFPLSNRTFRVGTRNPRSD